MQSFWEKNTHKTREYVLRALPKKRKTEKGPSGLLQCSHLRREGTATIKLEQVMGKRGWAFDSVHEFVIVICLKEDVDLLIILQNLYDYLVGHFLLSSKS